MINSWRSFIKPGRGIVIPLPERTTPLSESINPGSEIMVLRPGHYAPLRVCIFPAFVSVVPKAGITQPDSGIIIPLPGFIMLPGFNRPPALADVFLNREL